MVYTRPRARLERGTRRWPPELSLAVGEAAVGAGAAAPTPPQRAQLRLVRRAAERRGVQRIRAPASVPLPHPLTHGSPPRTATCNLARRRPRKRPKANAKKEKWGRRGRGRDGDEDGAL